MFDASFLNQTYSNCRESYLFEQKLDLKPFFGVEGGGTAPDTLVMIKGQTLKANNPPFILPLYFR